MARDAFDWLILMLIVLLGILCFAVLWPACATPVEAQESDHDASALYLARLCVNEAGFNSPRDCGGIYQVLRNTVREDEGILESMARHTKGRIFVVGGPGRNGQTVRSWTRGLHTGEHPPYGWPGHLSWSEYRVRFERVYNLSLRLVNARMPRACVGAPIAWGGPMDDHIALRRGLVRVSCGDTVNHYWERP